MRERLVLALDPSQPSDASSHLFEEFMDHDIDIILIEETVWMPP